MADGATRASPKYEGTVRATDAARAIRDKAREGSEDVAERARRVSAQAAQEAERVASTQQERMADRLESIAAAVNAAAETLREREESALGDGAARAAREVERLADRVRSQDVRALAHSLEQTGREHPDVFLGGSFAAGLALARFLRADRPSVGNGHGNGGPAALYGDDEDFSTELSTRLEPASGPTGAEPPMTARTSMTPEAAAPNTNTTHPGDTWSADVSSSVPSRDLDPASPGTPVRGFAGAETPVSGTSFVGSAHPDERLTGDEPRERGEGEGR